MISNEQMRVMCEEVIAERDPVRLDVLLGVMKTLCTQYTEERSLFVTPDKVSSASRDGNARGSKTGKKAA